MEAFAGRLRALRESAGLTQQALAVAAELSVSYVAKLERGVADPSWSTVVRLARALGVSVAAFAEEGPAPASEPAKGKRKGGKRS